MMDTLELPDETKPATRPQREETLQRSDPAAATASDRSASGRWRLGTLLVFVVALVALVPTTGDIGLTWDEPAYRYSQVTSAQWWDQLAHARSWGEARGLLDPETLLYYWPYARFGINFHPRAADGVGDRVCPDHRHRFRLPGSPVWYCRRSGHGRLAPAHAAALRPSPPDRYRYPRALPLGGDRAGVLERLARRKRKALARTGRRLARSGVRREDGRGRGSAAAFALACCRTPDSHSGTSRVPGRLDRRVGHIGAHAAAA